MCLYYGRYANANAHALRNHFWFADIIFSIGIFRFIGSHHCLKHWIQQISILTRIFICYIRKFLKWFQILVKSKKRSNGKKFNQKFDFIELLICTWYATSEASGYYVRVCVCVCATFNTKKSFLMTCTVKPFRKFKGLQYCQFHTTIFFPRSRCFYRLCELLFSRDMLPLFRL